MLAFSLAILLTALSGPNIQPIPDDVKKTVTVLYEQAADGGFRPLGTGFWTAVKIDDKKSATYLVTARHVLERPGISLLRLFARVNTLQGGSDLLRVDLIRSGPKKNVFVHSDQSVDLAVVLGGPDSAKHDVKFVGSDLIATRERFTELKIREGSELFFIGLFVPLIQAEKNIVLTRFGRVALAGAQPVLWNGVKSELYLVEAHSTGGNSGAPVFTHLGANREPGSVILGDPIIVLAGVVRGFFGEDLSNVTALPITGNSGIAAVTPAFMLYEILYGPALMAQRSSIAVR